MTKTELNQFRSRLEELLKHLSDERTQLRGEVFHAESATAAMGPAEQHTSDEISRGKEHEEVAVALLTAEEDQLAECRAALERIERGTFGRCERCQRAVSKRRLEALPHARLCIRCARNAAA
jgi:RNA polymerase-binding transcription factor DksA